jgi:hypothetical protein
MFRTLFTPLVARFDISPRGSPAPTVNTPRSLTSFAETDEAELDPEDFARDVLVELMRTAVDRLKAAEDMDERFQVSCIWFPCTRDQGWLKPATRPWATSRGQ